MQALARIDMAVGEEARHALARAGLGDHVAPEARLNLDAELPSPRDRRQAAYLLHIYPAAFARYTLSQCQTPIKFDKNSNEYAIIRQQVMIQYDNDYNTKIGRC